MAAGHGSSRNQRATSSESARECASAHIEFARDPRRSVVAHPSRYGRNRPTDHRTHEDQGGRDNPDSPERVLIALFEEPLSPFDKAEHWIYNPYTQGSERKQWQPKVNEEGWRKAH